MSWGNSRSEGCLSFLVELWMRQNIPKASSNHNTYSNFVPLSALCICTYIQLPPSRTELRVFFSGPIIHLVHIDAQTVNLKRVCLAYYYLYTYNYPNCCLNPQKSNSPKKLLRCIRILIWPASRFGIYLHSFRSS